jgi:hypothetical protein
VEDAALKFIPTFLFVPAIGILVTSIVVKGQSPSSPGTVKGSGCLEKAVESSCLVLIDSKTGNTYNLLFSGKAPKTGTAITFSGAEHQGATTCMQGKPVQVSKWRREKGIKCPPATKTAP